MTKKFWHTKTLFLQNGKYYKWSYKYTHCRECGNCDHKHKGRWLCTSCFDKERAKNMSRKAQMKVIWRRWHEKHYTRVVEKKKIVRHYTDESIRDYQRRWYKENHDAMLLLYKIKRRKLRWLLCMEIIIKWKTRFLPFESIVRPSKRCTQKEYDEYKKSENQFKTLVDYYNIVWTKSRYKRCWRKIPS